MPGAHVSTMHLSRSRIPFHTRSYLSQAATLGPIRRRLPRHWGRWLVEGLTEEVANGKDTGRVRKRTGKRMPPHLDDVCVCVCAQS